MRKINDKEKLVNLFQKWGVPNPKYWAEQELTNDRDAIVTMFRFLHVLQGYLSQYEDRTFRWIDADIKDGGLFGMGPSLKLMLDKGVSKETLNQFRYWIERMAYDGSLRRLANPSAIDDGLVGWPEWELFEVIYLDDLGYEEVITGRTLSRMPELFPFHDHDPEGFQALQYREWLQVLLCENRPVLSDPRSREQLMALFDGWDADVLELLVEEELDPKGHPNLAMYRLFYPLQLLLDMFLERTEEWMASEMDEPRSPLSPILKEMLGKRAKPEEIGKLTWLLFYWGCNSVLSRYDHLYSDRYDELPYCRLREIRSDGEKEWANFRQGFHLLAGSFPLRTPEWFDYY